MKKALLILIFLAVPFFSFASNLTGGNIFIEGVCQNESHQEFFSGNFKMEASALGFNVVENRADAAYTFRFDTQTYAYNPDNPNKFIVLISLILNDSDKEIVSFGWPFSAIEEMYEYNQFLFYRAAVLIPGVNPGVIVDDNRWKNKWIYFRLSVDYPTTYYLRLENGLYQGQYIYNGDINSVGTHFAEGDKFYALPGATAGVELQFLPFLSLESNFQISFGDTKDYWFLNMAVSGQLKFPLKFFKNFMIEPYGAFSYMINSSDIFKEFPDYYVGGGIQFGVKGGRWGAFFLDVNFMVPVPGFDNTDAVMYNPYGKKYYNPPMYENPDVIHYKRYVLNIGVGYKFGILNRKW